MHRSALALALAALTGCSAASRPAGDTSAAAPTVANGGTVSLVADDAGTTMGEDASLPETDPDGGTTARNPGTATDAAPSDDAGAAGDAAADILFNGDFETGDLSQWPDLQWCRPNTDRVVVYSAADASAGAPAPRQGNYAVHFHVLDTDVSPCTSTDNPRAEIGSTQFLKPGDDLWEAWSYYYPSSNPTLTGSQWMLFQEDYGPPWDGPPQIGWDVNPVGGVDSFALTRGSQYGVDTQWSMPVTKDAWTDFLVHKKFANDLTGGGFIEAWVDGNPLTFSGCKCTQLEMQTMQASQSQLEFYINLYRGHSEVPTMDVYFDAIRIGRTRASVTF